MQSLLPGMLICFTCFVKRRLISNLLSLCSTHFDSLGRSQLNLEFTRLKCTRLRLAGTKAARLRLADSESTWSKLADSESTRLRLAGSKSTRLRMADFNFTRLRFSMVGSDESAKVISADVS